MLRYVTVIQTHNTMQSVTWILTFVMVALVTTCRAATWTASCTMTGESAVETEAISGTVSFTQEDTSETVTVQVELTGFNETDNRTLHGFHIHQTGSTENNCASAGLHFDGVTDQNNTQGGPNASIRHVGDSGNVEEANGAVSRTFTDTVISLNATSNNYIIGRAVVIHQDEDALGDGDNPMSNLTGNAGARIGCCVIEDRISGAQTLTISFAALCLAVLCVFKW